MVSSSRLMSPVTAALVLVLLFCSQANSKPSETTHDILQRLGFDPVSRNNVNHHKKRVALETKARYNDAYSSDTDSHMYVVKLPPHHPYYSHSKPEKMSNEIITKPPMSFRTNGKPARVYHWNIPVLNKMSKLKGYDKKQFAGDSKIYHLKIKSEEGRHQYQEKPLKYHKNNVKMYKVHSAKKSTAKEHVLSIKELAENGMEAIKHHQHHQSEQNDPPVADTTHYKAKTKTKLLGRKSSSDRHANEVAKYHSKHDSPVYYSPAIPKQNSFYKYFPGNGKPKSFYVIEKSEHPSRYHRLL